MNVPLMASAYQEAEILLIEDNPSDAELTIRALKKSNLANNVFHVKDGEEALEFIFGNGRYADRDPNRLMDVILLDLKLPKVDGFEVLKRIKADNRLKLTPVVIVTSSQESRDLDEAYRLGANGYVVKPIDAGSFIDSLSQAGLYWLVINKPPR